MKNKYIILEKLEDLKFSGNHPNGINKGYKLQGWCVDEPIIGEQLFLYVTNDFRTTPSCWASRLVDIDMDNMVLETANSKYKIEINEDAVPIKLEDLQRAINNENTTH